MSVEDPGFPIGGCPLHRGGGQLPTGPCFIKFVCQNERIGTLGGALGPPRGVYGRETYPGFETNQTGHPKSKSGVPVAIRSKWTMVHWMIGFFKVPHFCNFWVLFLGLYKYFQVSIHLDIWLYPHKKYNNLFVQCDQSYRCTTKHCQPNFEFNPQTRTCMPCNHEGAPGCVPVRNAVRYQHFRSSLCRQKTIPQANRYPPCNFDTAAFKNYGTWKVVLLLRDTNNFIHFLWKLQLWIWLPS